MKIRASFVSNSSSSSFIIGSSKPLSKEILIKLMGVPKKSIMYPIVTEVAELFMTEAQPYDMEGYLANHFLTSEEDIPEKVKEILDKNWYFYEGSFSSSSDNILERTLTDKGFNIDTKTIYISKEEGY